MFRGSVVRSSCTGFGSIACGDGVCVWRRSDVWGGSVVEVLVLVSLTGSVDSSMETGCRVDG